MNLGKPVTPGQKIAIPADLMNVLRRMAQDYLAGMVGGAGAGTAGKHPEQILIRNDSGGTVSRFGVLGIGDVIFTPDDHLGKFQNGYAFKGVTPAVPYHTGKFVIMLDAVPDGVIGRGLLVGNIAVQVNVIDENHDFADVKDGDITQLQSGVSGAAQILSKQNGTGTKWAIIRMGNPVPFDVVPFDGSCMIDEANPDAQNPNAFSITNVLTGGPAYLGIGYPDDGTERRLLIKFRRPVVAGWSTTVNLVLEQAAQWTIDNNSGVNFPAEVGMMFKVDLVTSNFDYEGENCATWNDVEGENPTIETAEEKQGQILVNGNQFHSQGNPSRVIVSYGGYGVSLHGACILEVGHGSPPVYGLMVSVSHWWELGWGVRLWEASSTMGTSISGGLGCVAVI
jgi:hypothetical protein